MDVRSVRRSFGEKLALAGVDLEVDAGRVCALLGPNGAGKSTLLRILTGLITPGGGAAHVAGVDVAADPFEARRRIGFVPSGDRTFYLRISGIENLVFFGRLYGLSRGEARRRAQARLADVGLEEAAGNRVNTYSHGMQKRLSVARALLLDPPALLVDEATHDLDPVSARRVRQLVRRAAADGAAVVWATQRLEEIRGFADQVLVLDRGSVRFFGAVEELMLRSHARRYVLRIRSEGPGQPAPDAIQEIGGHGCLVEQVGTSTDQIRLTLDADVQLGDVLSRMMAAGLAILDCTQERSEIEEAFLRLTGDEAA